MGDAVVVGLLAVVATFGAVTDPLFGITWAQPQNLIFVLLVVPLCLIVVRRLFLLYKRVRLLASLEREPLLIKYFSWRREVGRTVLVVAAALLIQIALLRPEWGVKNEPVVQEGRSIVIALDISRSMAAKDVSPSRLALAKEKIKKVLEQLKADQVALIVFSGEALIACPLTIDYEAFLLLLDDISVETISSGTTNLTAAMEKIEALFFQQTTTGESRLALLLTDGENFSSGVEEAGEKLKNAGICVCTIGLGSREGAPVPLLENTPGVIEFQKDDAGHIVITRLDEMVLENIAKKTGGRSLRGQQDHSEIAPLVHWIEGFERKKRHSRCETRLEERYTYYVAGALLMLLFEVFL